MLSLIWHSKFASIGGNNMPQKIPIGISDFRKLISENCYFVDKSLLIKDVENSGDIVLYPRPRRFGKTLNLSMLRYFYDNSADNSHLFNGLAITQEKEVMQKQGKHPVIFISFKDVKSSNYEHCMNAIYDLIIRLFNENHYILDNNFMTEVDRKYFERILSKTGSLSDYENSLKNLAEYLSKYHQSNPVILIDEYDMPIQASYAYNYYSQMIEFIRNLLSGCLKDNVYLEKAVLTGILRVAKESIFSGLNNLKVLSMLARISADKFGFTESEVGQCLADFELSCRFDEVKKWYDGYNFGRNVEIYNPWSILNFIDENEFKPYWVNTSGNELIKTLLQKSGDIVKQDLETLIADNSIAKTIEDNIVYADVDTSEEALWSFLLMSGYLRFDNLVFDENGYRADLRIPNKEVRYLFKNEIIRKWFSSISTHRNLTVILDNLIRGDLEIFKYSFIEFCQSSFSYFDVGGDEPEKFYHAFVLGLIVSLRDQYIIKSNRESGYGKYDVMLIPKNANGRGIIFEFKKVNKFKNEDIEAGLEAAKQQIISKKYADELKASGVTDIVNIAAVFDKKAVDVEVWKEEG